MPRNRVSFETSFDSKQPKLEPKLEPKLVLALSETKRLFRLFRFYTETESFGVSIEPKQTEEQLKQCDREHNLEFFTKFRVVSVCFGLFRNSLFWLFRFYTKTESFNVSIEPNKQKTNRNSLIESIFWDFKENLGLFRFVSKQFCLFQLFG